jgi:uncharacterized membrane protein
MAGENLVLCVASYPDVAAAGEDFGALKKAQNDGDFRVVGAVVVSRDADGKVDVDEHGGHEVAGVSVLGGVGGLVIGLFAPPLLLSTAIGAGIGAGIGALVKRHEEKELGVEVEDVLPPGSSAVVVVVDDLYADRVEAALEKAAKKMKKAIDADDYEQLEKALADTGHDLSAAAGS